jgi:hypothetical protein
MDHQTARIWDGQSGETKMELRGHEHVVEVAVFAPVAAYPAIRELGGLTVSALLLCACVPSGAGTVTDLVLLGRVSVRRRWGSMSRQVREIRP